MPNRIAASLALVAFAMCLLVGLQAGNTFSTTVLRALLAMGGTYVIGLVLGMMGDRMVEENLKAEEEKSKNSSQKMETNDR
ncbi:MAG: hypothetical protein ACM359_07690 [Bacillota bacterium]